MPSLFVACSTGGAPSPQQTVKRMMDAAYRVRREQGQIVTQPGCSLGATHHGILRSGGCADDERGIVAVAGSIWLESSDEQLASPMELLQSMHSNQPAEFPIAMGNYCAGYWRGRCKTLLLEAEKTGAYSIYYALGSNGLIAATELKCLLATGMDHGGPDAEGIGEYLSLGHIASHRTFFRHIKRIPSGHSLRWRDGQVELSQTWRYHFPRDQILDDERLEQMYETLKIHVRRYGLDTKRFGLSLSGGLDSRTLAAVAKQCGLNFETMSMGPKASLECAIGREVAEAIGVELHSHEYDGSDSATWLPRAIWLSEGRCPPNHIHYFDGMFVGKYIDAPHIHGMTGGPVLGGDYCDEQPVEGSRPDSLRDNCLRISRKSWRWWPSGSRDAFSAELANLITVMPKIVTEELIDLYEDIADGGSTEAFRFWFRNSPLIGAALSAQVLPWTDIICPFADPELIRQESVIRAADLSERKLQYRMANAFFPELTRIPRIKDGRRISMDRYDPHEYARKMKFRSLIRKGEYFICRASAGRFNFRDNSGFQNYEQWYRRHKNLRAFFSNVLLGPQAAARGLWNTDYLKRLMEDLRRGKNIWGAVASILFVEMYLQQALDATGRPTDGKSVELLVNT